MHIYLFQNDQQTGPFTVTEVTNMLSEGSIRATDLCWHEDLSEWTALSSILSSPTPTEAIESEPPQLLIGRKKKKGEFVGVGAAVQAAGCLTLLVGIALCLTVVGLLFGIPGIIVGLILMIIGGRMAIKLICSNCGNKLSGKEVRVCPTCHCQFEK